MPASAWNHVLEILARDKDTNVSIAVKNVNLDYVYNMKGEFDILQHWRVEFDFRSREIIF